MNEQIDIPHELSAITEENPLYELLDTGRLHKKFKNITLIGEGGLGKVYKATYYIDKKEYAIKVVRLHIHKDGSDNDPIE